MITESVVMGNGKQRTAAPPAQKFSLLAVPARTRRKGSCRMLRNPGQDGGAPERAALLIGATDIIRAMSKPLPLTDFRARRWILEQGDFAYAPAPRPPASDLIPEQTWKSIMGGASDVSIVTTDHFGSTATELHKLWGAWVQTTPLDAALWKGPMLDIADELQGATFAWIHGYYRLALAALRSALECAATAAALLANPAEIERWQKGELELRFSDISSRLLKRPEFTFLQDRLVTSGQGRFLGRNGWVGILYFELAKFSHSRPGKHTAAALWDFSNGPIYNPSAARYVARIWRIVYATSCLLFRAVVPTLAFESPALALMADSSRSEIAHAAWRFLDAPYSTQTHTSRGVPANS